MDERFLKEEGTVVYTGNELLLKGALEAGCSLITGYPGSPVSEVFDVASENADLLRKRGVLAEMASNEALAVARLNGSRMAGVRAMAVMKSVGLHVASDGLAIGNLSEPENAGGSIVVVGDDPWIESTQINSDSRFLSQHLHMPVLEPATFQEMKDWVHSAFELSSASDLYITYLLTTPQADGGGTVWAHPNRRTEVNREHPVTLQSAAIQLEKKVLLPPRTWQREATLPARFERLLQKARELKLNVVIPPGRQGGIHQSQDMMDPVPLTTGGLSLPLHSKDGDGLRHAGMTSIGFIASGLSYCYLEHALQELGLAGRFPILKLGLTYPVDPEMVLSFAHQVETLVVIEEKRGFVEAQVLQVLHDAGVQKPLWGKKFPQGLAGIPEHRGLNPSVLMERLIPLLSARGEGTAKLRAEQEILEATQKTARHLPVRTPTFCPGCPHRDSSSVFLQIKNDFMDSAYMRRTHRTKPIDLIFHGETGCFTMLMFEPNQSLMHNYSGMGLGGGTGAGADPFITNKQIVFLGDSTFFHSGMVAVSDSLKSGQDITYVILDNKTTAMTGHQPTAGTDVNIMGEPTYAQNIQSIVQAMAGQNVPVTRINPGDRDDYRALLEKTIMESGVKVVIADKECGLTFQRRERQAQKQLVRRVGYLPEERHIQVNQEACEYCLECTNTTGCPGLAVVNTLYGPKITTDTSSCVSDGACAKVNACPAFEEVIVQRRRAPDGTRAIPAFGPLPEPRVFEMDPSWSAFTAGVGGQGAGLVTAVLVQAAQRDGLRVLFSEKKGLAVRNGSVYAQVLVSRSGGVLSPVLPYGKANLILGIDLLEAARGVDPAIPLRVAHPALTAAVVNTATTPTVRMLLGTDSTETASSESALRESVMAGEYWGEDLSALSERYLGSTLYANIMLLGAACQRGKLPFALKTLEASIADSVSAAERPPNLQAFRLGRAITLWPETFRAPTVDQSYVAILTEKHQILSKAYGNELAQDYRALAEETALAVDIDETAHRDLALRIYDLIQYEGYSLAERYALLVRATAAKDRREWGFQATRAVIHQAFKVIAIKDEVYVAHLLTSPEKRARDQARYEISASRGDRLGVRHFNRPEFTIGGKTIRWNMRSRDWQLQLMKRLKVLRRLLPGWHILEKEFRDWYLDLVVRFEADTENSYAIWVNVLNSPESVRGYRDIRYPKMVEAKRRVGAWLRQIQEIGDLIPADRKPSPSFKDRGRDSPPDVRGTGSRGVKVKAVGPRITNLRGDGFTK